MRKAMSTAPSKIIPLSVRHLFAEGLALLGLGAFMVEPNENR